MTTEMWIEVRCKFNQWKVSLSSQHHSLNQALQVWHNLSNNANKNWRTPFNNAAAGCQQQLQMHLLPTSSFLLRLLFFSFGNIACNISKARCALLSITQQQLLRVLLLAKTTQPDQFARFDVYSSIWTDCWALFSSSYCVSSYYVKVVRIDLICSYTYEPLSGSYDAQSYGCSSMSLSNACIDICQLQPLTARFYTPHDHLVYLSIAFMFYSCVCI